MSRPKQATKIAVLDMETDPFDPEKQETIHPFLAVLYSEDFKYVIWNEDHETLLSELNALIESLKGRYIIYAHNGGRFDYMFLIHKLRGQVSFKGRSLMSARIGDHEIRDSLHIIPEALENAAGKERIDYSFFAKSKRKDHREEIIEYCISDCKYAYDIISAFVDSFGTPLTIGQAAMRELKKNYDVARLSESTDAMFRKWYLGGRVDCFQNGFCSGDFSVFDVNSMYPAVMAQYPHPIGSDFLVNNCIRSNTVFISLRCNNYGALLSRKDDGGLTSQIRQGVFHTTIWEYEVAMKHGLITNPEIIQTIEFEKFSDFSKFVIPLYDGRRRIRELKKKAEQSGDLYMARKYAQDEKFMKYLLNNAYGKFAQNPRRWKNYFITEPDDKPDIEELDDIPEVLHDDYWIWSKPCPDLRFNNVATAASITGAARSVLLDALVTANSPLYCDTDSIICRDLGSSCKIDALELGAWDLEAKANAFIGAGKKLYGYHIPDKKPPKDYHIRAKGMNGVTWQDLLDIASGQTKVKFMNAPTLTKDGGQHYIARQLRNTMLDLATIGR